MSYNKKIAVIGGTGKSGTYLVEALIKMGYRVNMLVRNTEHLKIKSQNIEVINGTVEKYDAILNTLKGCKAVISTLGLGIPPSSPDIFTQSTGSILKAMDQTGITRYIVITGLNVDTPYDSKGEASANATQWMYDTYPASTKNKQQEYDLLAESITNWTMVRLPMIKLTDETGNIAINLSDCPGSHINAPALANFLVSQIDDGTYSNKAPFIANK